MMIEVAFTTAFVRSLKHCVGKNPARRKRFEKALATFIEDPYAEALRTHKLSGKLKERWSFTVEYYLRVILRFLDNGNAVFEEIGGHDDVY